MAQSSALWDGQVPSVVSGDGIVPSFVPLYGMVPLFLVTVRYGAVAHVTYHGMVTYTYFVLSFNGLVPSFISRATVWCRVSVVSCYSTVWFRCSFHVPRYGAVCLLCRVTRRSGSVVHFTRHDMVPGTYRVAEESRCRPRYRTV